MRGGPRSAAAAAPLARAGGWLLALGDGEGKKQLHLGPTALGRAYGRSAHDRFIHFIPSHSTLWVRLNQFVVVILGSFVSPLINNRVTGQLSHKTPGACARKRGDLCARQYRAYY